MMRFASLYLSYELAINVAARALVSLQVGSNLKNSAG
jgi:hypothetical protein